LDFDVAVEKAPGLKPLFFYAGFQGPKGPCSLPVKPIPAALQRVLKSCLWADRLGMRFTGALSPDCLIDFCGTIEVVPWLQGAAMEVFSTI